MRKHRTVKKIADTTKHPLDNSLRGSYVRKQPRPR